MRDRAGSRHHVTRAGLWGVMSTTTSTTTPTTAPTTTSSARIPRSLDPLTEDDLAVVRRRVGGRRHQVARNDHSGSWARCPGCEDVAYWSAIALGARARTKGWTRAEALAYVASGRVAVDSIIKDGERMRRGSAGVPTRPDIVACAKVFTIALDRAWLAGELSLEPHHATAALRWAITYAGDPGEQVHDGGFLPFDRIARSLVAGPCGGGISEADVVEGWVGLGRPEDQHRSPADRCERLWYEIERACACDVKAAAKLDEVMAPCSDRLGRHTVDGAAPATVAAEPVGGCNQEPSAVVLGAAARLEHHRAFWGATSEERRLALAIPEVVAAFCALHQVEDTSLATRPEILEIALEVLAELGASST